MKILLASDIHGSATYCRELVLRINEEHPDHILILGDILYHGPRNDLPQEYNPKEVISLLNPLARKIIAVRGNCEAEVDQMVLDFSCMGESTTLLLLDGRTLFATHGHIWNPDKLPPFFSQSIFCYGHTHVKQLEQKEIAHDQKTVFVNPGSISIPKDGSHSYGVITEDSIVLKDLFTKAEINKLDLTHS